MSIVSERTRLGLHILGVATLAGVLGDALLRAMPWGVNAFVCAVALIGAAWWLVRRHHVAAGRDALWLAGARLAGARRFAGADGARRPPCRGRGFGLLLSVPRPSP